jgi:hypothetical protein
MPAQEKNMSNTKPKVQRFVIYNDVRTLSAEEIDTVARELYLAANDTTSQRKSDALSKVREALLALLCGGHESGAMAIMLDTTHEQYEATAHPNNFWR